MKKVNFLLMASGLVFPGLSEAMDFGGWSVALQPRIEFGVARYEFNFSSVSQTLPVPNAEEPLTISTGKVKFEDTLPTVSGGLTLSIDRFFIDLSALKAFNGDVNDSTSFTTVEPNLTRTRATTEVDTDEAERSEYSISIGYAITDAFSVFTGYKIVKDTFNDVSISGPVTIENPDNTVDTATLLNETDFRFKYNGPFIGAAYGLSVDKSFMKGYLTAVAGVAFLDGRFNVSPGFDVLVRDGRVEPLPPETSNEAVYETDGDTVGVSLGLTWQGSTPVENLSYLINVNGYNYNFQADDSDKPDINETFINFKVGISYRF